MNILSLFLFLIASTYPLIVSLDSNPFCFNITETSYHFQYKSLSSSVIQATIQEQQKQLIILTGSENKTSFVGSGESQICLKGLDSQISIDFYKNEITQIKKAALKSEVYELHEKILQLGQNLKELIHLGDFHEYKQMYDKNSIEQKHHTIRIFAFLKIMIVVLILIRALYLLQCYLKR